MKDVSEVAAMRARIEQECRALRNLSLFSSSSSHEVISASMRRLDEMHNKLARVVGEQGATELTVHAYNKAMGAKS